MRTFIKSFGCSTNYYDGTVLAGCLSRAGHELTESVLEADVIIYNTCAVKGPTENRMIDALKRVPEDKLLIVAGCLPLVNFERLRKEVRFDGAVGPAAGSKIVGVVARVLNGHEVVAIGESAGEKPMLDLPRRQESSVISIIPASYGCLGSCAYCCVRSARGSLRSYDVEEIVERLKQDLVGGYREFWITSQDVACFGRDKGTDLSELLCEMCKVDGTFKVRVGMMTPNNVVTIREDLIRAFSSSKVFKFLHLPVQSGDDEILGKMQRFYSVDDFKNTVKAFRHFFSDISLSTDVICGFPGESPAAFGRTLSLIEEVKPDIVNVSKFFPRPKTPAMNMQKDFVASSEIMQRTKMASAISRRIASGNNQRWVGWTGDVLIDEVGKISGSWVGRNFAYKPVVVKSSEDLLGKSLQVKIVRASQTCLEAKLCG